jgi:hypothetical protein
MHQIVAMEHGRNPIPVGISAMSTLQTPRRTAMLPARMASWAGRAENVEAKMLNSAVDDFTRWQHRFPDSE